MDPIRLFKILGGIAGLAGIAFGVFLLLFQGVLQQKFLPSTGLDSAQAFAVVMALMVLTFGLSGVGIVAWLIFGLHPAKAPVPPYAVIVLALLLVSVLVSTMVVGFEAIDRKSPVLTQSPTTSPTPPQTTTRSFRVCTGEYERACDAHDAYLYCGVDPASWAKGRCDSFKVQQLNSRGGNKCGYTLFEVICTSAL
jgi:hypothetical protein